MDILLIDEYDRTSKKVKKRIAKLALKARLPMHLANRSSDLPMTGVLTRESKKRNAVGLHRFVLVLKFKHSRRWYADEVIHAVDMKRARELAKRMFPNATIGKR